MDSNDIYSKSRLAVAVVVYRRLLRRTGID